MRRLLGRHRVAYRVSEPNSSRASGLNTSKNQRPLSTKRLVTRAVAEDMGLAYVHLDPLKLDYKMVTETFGGPFAERHLVIPISETREEMTLAMANLWDTALLQNISQVKGKKIHAVVAQNNKYSKSSSSFMGFGAPCGQRTDYATDIPTPQLRTTL